MSDTTGFDDHAATWRPALDVGHVLAAIPHLIGFYPKDSLVLVILDDQDLILATYRVDLPESGHHRRVVGELYGRLTRDRAARKLFVVIVGDDETSVPGGLHAPLVREMTAGAARVGFGIRAVGVPGIASQARWFEYGEHRATGRVPDPDASPLHLAMVLQGMVTRADREDLIDLVRADPREDLDRRARMYHDALGSAFDEDAEPERPKVMEQRYRAILHQVERAATRVEPLTDAEIVEMGVALTDHEVRDWCLELALGEHAVTAERLWLELTRRLPDAACAEAASLAAISAYVRGDGTLARIAIDRAQSTQPDADHRLTNLVDAAITVGMEPARMRLLCEKAQHHRRHFSERS
ncbi:DUF4192 domain-containing protein [Saccharothrix obliqua]|uniref:DUF4192 domain-containing protein n=1 Tax=Saccharothrix obliqua TaxID=2861747 RepID=UPI001C5F01E1|nr:DUF4192 domain-containing protein [Saccharothrix obliqua]MBW4722278.1 DUF4192 domain-containing protein [Saccharothrix obliqua]